jgi:hypothetical protein
VNLANGFFVTYGSHGECSNLRCGYAGRGRLAERGHCRRSRATRNLFARRWASRTSAEYLSV